MNRISELLHDKEYLFKSPGGVASLLMLKQKASNLFNWLTLTMTKMFIKFQVKLKKNRKIAKSQREVSKTWRGLTVAKLQQNLTITTIKSFTFFHFQLSKTLSAALFGNIITAVVTSHPFMLQIALGLLTPEKKNYPTVSVTVVRRIRCICFL